MLSTSAGVEPTTSWSPVGRRIQLSHRGHYLWGCTHFVKINCGISYTSAVYYLWKSTHFCWRNCHISHISAVYWQSKHLLCSQVKQGAITLWWILENKPQWLLRQNLLTVESMYFYHLACCQKFQQTFWNIFLIFLRKYALCLGRAAACDCDTLWTFLLPFLTTICTLWANSANDKLIFFLLFPRN